tara:strand:+ start:299 stop:451 length:153 start_codon:yes stop_codon:yes gene_type:complete
VEEVALQKVQVVHLVILEVEMVLLVEVVEDHLILDVNLVKELVEQEMFLQ